MKIWVYFSFLFILTACQVTFIPKKPTILSNNFPPQAKKVPKQLSIHGETRTDNYFWLREKENQDVTHYLELENNYTDEVMADTRDFQEKVYLELKSRIPDEDKTFPYLDGNFHYYSKTVRDKNYRQYWRKSNFKNATEELILDVNELAGSNQGASLGELQIHPQQNLMAYSFDQSGSRVYIIYFKDLNTGKVLAENIPGVGKHFRWAESGKIIFYAKLDPTTLRQSQIFRYDLDTKKNELIFEEKDTKFNAEIDKTFSRNYLLINSVSATTSETWILDSHNPLRPLVLFNARKTGHLYYVEDDGKVFYIRSNFNARNFQIFKTRMDHTEFKNWKLVIKHNPSVMLENMLLFEKFLVLQERKNGLSLLHVISKKKNHGDYISFPDPSYRILLKDNVSFKENKVRYEFESLNRPTTLYDYDFTKKESKLLKEDQIIGYNSADYTSELIYAKAKDGASIPISLLYRKDIPHNGSAALLIEGYGSYGINYPVFFSSRTISLLDRGFIYAIAHVRGGSELGRSWYENGKLLHKKNTFFDFIAATEFLIQQKYAHPKKIYAAGKSAGGLLMGAIVNYRPDLYHGIIAQVPFVDIVTTMLDSSLPLTTEEYEEWGNPNNKIFYDYMKSYSPYDQISNKDYPNILATAGLNDRQVSYWEPAKWVAKLREMRTNKSKLILLKTNMQTGHSGKSGRYDALRDVAFRFAFLWKLNNKNNVEN